LEKLLIKPWEDICDYFRELAKLGDSFEAMANLVRAIERSRYKEGIFGWTSMHDLCIVQTRVSYPHYEPYLRISPVSDGQLEFRYIDTSDEKKQWHRVVEGADGFHRLESFLEQLHWFA
jgi:hypothetical protein